MLRGTSVDTFLEIIETRKSVCVIGFVARSVGRTPVRRDIDSTSWSPIDDAVRSWKLVLISCRR
jgi:hypothetical protein